MEYFLATTFQLWPCSMALPGGLGLRRGLGQDDPHVARCGVPNCDLWLL